MQISIDNDMETRADAGDIGTPLEALRSISKTRWTTITASPVLLSLSEAIVQSFE